MKHRNLVILVGNLGKDPLYEKTRNDDDMAIFPLCTNINKGDSEEIEWHNIVAFGNSADNMRNFLQKGTKVYIEGRKRTNKYTDRDGEEREQCQIIVENWIAF